MADRFEFEALPVEKLWSLYHDIRSVLTNKLSEQKRDLDIRLRSLSQQDIQSTTGINEKLTERKPAVRPSKDGARRAYPKVLPLYRNPSEPSETWSGRGNKPRWLAAQVNAGKDVSDFLINKPAGRGASKSGSRAKSGRRTKAG